MMMCAWRWWGSARPKPKGASAAGDANSSVPCGKFGERGLSRYATLTRRILARQAGELKERGQAVAVYGDLRRVFDSNEVDAVILATPNHWHALATIWACQAGKDVYVEKPISHNIWEGRQMVAAARKYGRIVQSGTQARTSSALQEAVAWVQRSEIGPIQFGRVLLYRERSSIGKVTAPTPIPRKWITTCGAARPTSCRSGVNSCTTTGIGSGPPGRARWATTAFTTSMCAVGR